MVRLMARLAVIAMALVLGAASAASAGPTDVRFTSAPKARPDGEGLRVEFAVSGPTDVEVAILDQAGKVVRHLAAGVLGGKAAPPAPLREGLAQELRWDGKDDFGKTAAGGPFRARVRAGMGIRLGRFIGDDPYTFGGINSIATDEQGQLYCMGYDGGLNQNFDTLRVFTASGRYVRTLIPFPTDLPAEAAEAFASWDPASGTFRPRNRLQTNPAFVPWVAGARLVSASSRNGLVLSHGNEIYRLDASGGNLRGPLPMWSKQAKLENPKWNVPQMAVSPDGRYIYYSNVAGTKYDTKSPAEINPAWPNGRVYRQDTSQAGADPQAFFDLTLPDFQAAKYWMPNAWNKRTAAAGLDTDDKGNVYVCDLVNQEIVQVSPEGKRLASVKVPWPNRVHVNRVDGSLYVISSQPKDGSRPERLLKLSGCGPAGRVVAEMALTGRLGDASGLGRIDGQAVLWLAGGDKLVALKDAGDKFEPVATAFAPAAEAQPTFSRITVDPIRDEVYVSDGASRLWRYDGESGAGELLKKGGRPFEGVDLSVSYDGLLYVRTGKSFSGPLERFNRQLEPAPFESGTHVLSKHIYSRYGVGNCEKGLGVGPQGECYISFMYGWNEYLVAGFGPDGRPIKGLYLEGIFKPDPKAGYPEGLDTAVIGPVLAQSGGVRVDLAGNIYLGLRSLPKDHVAPTGYEKDPAYGAFSGSVVKFGPKGGTTLNLKDGQSRQPNAPKLEMAGKVVLENALAAYPGIAPFSGGGYGANQSVCVCRVPRFDVDRFGRVMMPNCVTNRVAVCDNTGNAILEAGAYGNFDSLRVDTSTEEGKAGKPVVAGPAIPLGWPTGIGASDRFLYVNDTCNRRVVRLDKTWQAEAVCPVP